MWGQRFLVVRLTIVGRSMMVASGTQGKLRLII
jgi:hypothetical protein